MDDINDYYYFMFMNNNKERALSDNEKICLYIYILFLLLMVIEMYYECKTVIYFCTLIDNFLKKNIYNKKLISISEIENDIECSICLKKIENDKVKIDCECKYYYHRECILEWLILKNNCPTCRKILFI